MPNNFSYLLEDPTFSAFSSAAVAAEKIYKIDAAACALNCRKAMELAVRWMYSVDSALEMPYNDSLAVLMNGGDFRDIVGDNLWRRMDFIRSRGNDSAHSQKVITSEQARLCLENLFIFLDFVAYCYGKGELYTTRTFDASLLESEEPSAPPAVDDKQLTALIEENRALREQLTQRRERQRETYVEKPIERTEYETRRLYIDAMLQDVGWTQGLDWLDEVQVDGMPTASGRGYADYVLYDGAHRPLAVVEAKRTCEDVGRGRHQAELYADALQKKYGRRPVIFLTNGFETRIIDGQYPERSVAHIYSRRDLEKLFNLKSGRGSLSSVDVNPDIAGRWYQKGAVRAVCDSFDRKNRRKALLVMATGSGKTRTVIALCDVLLRRGWVKNILFLADRTTLVTQAKRSFVNLLPNLSCANLCESKADYTAHCIFSTYQTMMNCIDDVKDEQGRLYTCGHFDLVICDEAHRSIYNKYRDIFEYFDAPLVGLTATPKDEIDKNTYEVFQLEKGAPTYGYELSQAVADGYLVDFISIETRLKFLEQGIAYDELSEEEKEEYERNFCDENGELPERIDSSALNEWLFNRDTIREVLHILMTQGLTVDYGSKIGKTIIFAKNHLHAEKIREIFEEEYPHLVGFARVIDNYDRYAQKMIDKFSEREGLPQIAISVDMLDTGIDVPEVLNLVFFKKVMSKAKFWQMIGRGTRLCPQLIDGEDKQMFYIFDFCGNFNFFRMNPEGNAAPSVISVQAALFQLKAQLALKLQDLDYQTEELTAFRRDLVADMLEKVQALNRENFAVKMHLKAVERFSMEESYQMLTYADTLVMGEEIAPLVAADADHPKALRFDVLLYGMELAALTGKKYSGARNDLLKRVRAVAKLGNLPEVAAQSELIEKILHTDFVDHAGVDEFEHIRTRLRELMKLVTETPHSNYETDFSDLVIGSDWNESELENADLQNYKAKAEFYIRQHTDNEVIAKLHGNVPLNESDVRQLEFILWNQIGSQQDYQAEYGHKPLGEMVREIVGMDMKAAKEAFSEFLDDANLDSRQIYFVNQIVEYIVRNGMMKDLSVLQEPPFTANGSIIQVFDDLRVWARIRKSIEKINQNVVSA